MSDNNPWDQFHKALLEEQLSGVGRVVPGLELGTDLLKADVAFFWPEGGIEPRRLGGLGVLGQMVEVGACVFEPHSTHPGEEALRSAGRWTGPGRVERGARGAHDIGVAADGTRPETGACLARAAGTAGRCTRASVVAVDAASSPRRTLRARSSSVTRRGRSG